MYKMTQPEAIVEVGREIEREEERMEGVVGGK